ncbi:DUF1127 domain-containing protein [Wenxinia marina]|uniref:YjiS-like domain-containing protein n=1 Tax=Wenxinia marina DSM 24838 TaxID=1123501 RepID=A0A0D0NJB9_9RHOB|nr:DUF1127 domain-containing protein [Wenxinia marina]KIQ68435.1 hypothetical protein Wenmar_03082 [Wenxinia marina DSM 24838]GGL72283.1 hypothetical protein GCM10011392_28540 [Wenxinia marina]
MAHIELPRNIAVSIAAGRAVRTAYDLLDRLVESNDARITRSALSKLSAHELDDIGLCRGDIDAIAAASSRRF